MMLPSLQLSVSPALQVTEETSVFPAYAGTPEAASLPLFGDDVWDMRVLRVRRNQPLDCLVIDFRPFTNPIRRLVAKEYLYARLTIRHPQHRRLAVTGMKGEYYRLRRFLTYLDTAWEGVTLANVTQTMLDAYLLHCRQGKKGQVIAASTVQDHILIPIKLAAYCTAFSTDALQLVPWKGKSAQSIVGANRTDENTTPRIPEAVLGPLIQWALFYVQMAAKDILAARAELAEYREAPPKSFATSRRERLEAWIAARRAAGRGLPANEARFQHHYKEPASALNGVNGRLIGQMAGVSEVHDRFLRPIIEQAAAEMGLEPGGMDTPISCHPATQQPWRERFSPLSLHHEEYMLVAACYIVCAYLSGMRVSEVMHLQRGCHFTETTADGLITRHKLRGTTFKDHGRRGVPATWVVIAPAAEAIAVLEQLTDRDELFWAQRLKPQTVPYGAVVQHTYFLKTFCDHVNSIAHVMRNEVA
jgi:hypothetical protein